MSNRKSKNEKEREKIVQDRLQILLTRMLQDDDNKYCVDCDSKGKIKQKSIHS
jgi:stromal membrane-associated protein